MEPKDLADNFSWKKIKKEYKTQGSNYAALQEKLLVLSKQYNNEGELIWSRLEEICSAESYLEYLKTEPWSGQKHIRELFDPTSFYIRQDLARKLKEVADRRITNPILNLLKVEEDWFVKTQLLAVLGQLRDNRSLEHLMTFLNEDSWLVSYEAACAIAKIGKPESLPYLVSYLEKQETIKGQAKALRILGYLNRPEILPLFREALKSNEPEIQMEAIEGLFHLKSAKTFALLKESLRKTKKDVRAKIVELLSHYPPKDTIPLLIETLKDPSFLVRRAACFSLANLRDEEALIPLSELMMDSYSVNGKYPVREAAKLAIKKFKGGKEFLEALESEVVPPRTSRDTLLEPETLIDEDGVTQPRLGALKSKILATYRNPANIINPGMDEELSSSQKKQKENTKKVKTVRTHKPIARKEEGVQKTSKSEGISQIISEEPLESEKVIAQKPVPVKLPPTIAPRNSRISRVLGGKIRRRN